MRITLAKKDLDFLKRADELGREGKTQDEIAAAMGLAPSTFRTQVRELGFGFTRRTELFVTLTGESLGALLERGECAAEEPAAQPVAA